MGDGGSGRGQQLVMINGVRVQCQRRRGSTEKRRLAAVVLGSDGD